MSTAGWTVAVEGDTDVAVAAAILRAEGRDVGRVHVCDGKTRLDERLRGFAAAAVHAPWLVLRDLDHDAECPPRLLQQLRPGGAIGVVRIAVRAVEAWLLADAAAAAKWLRIPMGRVPTAPERLVDPKRELIKLARASAAEAVRVDMVPRGTASIGPGYVDQVRRFCSDLWRPEVASKRAPSLAKCLRYVRRT